MQNKRWGQARGCQGLIGWYESTGDFHKRLYLKRGRSRRTAEKLGGKRHGEEGAQGRARNDDTPGIDRGPGGHEAHGVFDGFQPLRNVYTVADRSQICAGRQGSLKVVRDIQLDTNGFQHGSKMGECGFNATTRAVK